MSSGVEAITTTALSLALDAATLRHQVIATNIANAGTTGFVPRRASFEAHLSASAMPGPTAHPAAAPELQVRIEPAVQADGQAGGVHLDSEVAAMAENSLHYQALVRALNRHLGILASAVTEGKR